MEIIEIKTLIDEFIFFIENGAKLLDDKDENLLKLLDHLGLAQSFVTFTFDNTDYPEPPVLDQNKTRKMIENSFPEYGYYNVPEHLTEKLEKTNVFLGDAIDDILDIYCELKHVKWSFENTSVDDGLWLFQFLYQSHWGQHLRSLQLYLYMELYRK